MENKKFNGDRLKSARLYNGWTLQELADKTEISKQSISLYENKRSIPEYERVYKMARVLGFPFDYFFGSDITTTTPETTYFRSFSTATKKDCIAQSIKLELVARMYEVLLQYLEFPKFNDPNVSFEGFDDAFTLETSEAIEAMEVVAAKVRKYWGTGTGPIKDFQYMLEKNGILVTGFPANKDRIDAFSQRTVVDGYGIFLIAVVLGRLPECRIRFDMAHELGHILLHPWSEDLEALSKDEFNVREKQANMFASALLLPREAFGRDISQYPTNLKYYEFLKEKWNVSMQAMLYRTRQLKIITANQYQYLMRQVSKNGWRTCEPGDEIPGDLNESIFQGAVDCLFENHILSPKTLMQDFRRNGIDLYPDMIEDLLHLKTGTLCFEDKVIPLFQIKPSVTDTE